jgi:dihydroxy-acid dehydratase
MVVIDAVKNRIDITNVDDAELRERKKNWKPPVPKVRRGALAKYARLVGDASHGAVTDQWHD